MKGKADNNTIVLTGDNWIGIRAAFVLLTMQGRPIDFVANRMG